MVLCLVHLNPGNVFRVWANVLCILIGRNLRRRPIIQPARVAPSLSDEYHWLALAVDQQQTYKGDMWRVDLSWHGKSIVSSQ